MDNKNKPELSKPHQSSFNSGRCNKPLYTLQGKLKDVHMDSKRNGGVHLWLSGIPIENVGESGKSHISVHLTKKEVNMLIEELLYRRMKSVWDDFEHILRILNSI